MLVSGMPRLLSSPPTKASETCLIESRPVGWRPRPKAKPGFILGPLCLGNGGVGLTTIAGSRGWGVGEITDVAGGCKLPRLGGKAPRPGLLLPPAGLLLLILLEGLPL